MSKLVFNTAYNRNLDFIRDVGTVEFTAPNKVKKSLSYAVDINTIYDNFCKTSKLPLNGRQPLYDENFVNYDSLIEAQKVISEASEYFNGLPADIKNNYGNDLKKFVLALNKGDKYLYDKGVLNHIKVDIKPVDKSVVAPSSDVPSVETPTTVETSLNTVQAD